MQPVVAPLSTGEGFVFTVTPSDALPVQVLTSVTVTLTVELPAIDSVNVEAVPVLPLLSAHE